jgi:hypothetical protein
MATWDAVFEAKPNGGDVPSTLDNEQRNHRKAVEERMKNEHDTYTEDGTVGNLVKDWVHKEGSAMAYYESDEPTNQPNGEALAARDAGRLWWDSDDNELRCWDGSAMQTIKKISGDLELGGTVTSGVKTDGTFLKTKVIEIGDWNMDTTSSVAVAHGLTLADIRTVTVIIRDDSEAFLYSFFGSVSSSYARGTYQVESANITLQRVTNGLFDSPFYNSTSFNRGWITIMYEA